jgi:hypothetical protein
MSALASLPVTIITGSVRLEAVSLVAISAMRQLACRAGFIGAGSLPAQRQVCFEARLSMRWWSVGSFTALRSSTRHER